jgi:hypothetical protein
MTDPQTILIPTDEKAPVLELDPLPESAVSSRPSGGHASTGLRVNEPAGDRLVPVARAVQLGQICVVIRRTEMDVQNGTSVIHQLPKALLNPVLEVLRPEVGEELLRWSVHSARDRA